MAAKMFLFKAAVTFVTLSAAASQTCPDKVLVGVGVGGPGATALLNVTSMAECCTMCHTNYHDECVAWIWGQTGSGKEGHNCALMPKLLPRRSTANHTSGVPQGTPPGPSPPGPPQPMGNACNADLDCELTGMNWRCEHSSSAPTSTNNCHLPGPGTKGNSTCACTSQTCGSTNPNPTNASLVQYLMIGDSISLGMLNDVTTIMNSHGWSTTHNPGNAASSNLGAHCLKDWITPTRKWDVISFNFGLHDLGYDTERISVQNYTLLMTAIVDDLVAVQKEMKCKLIWVDTTPVPTVPTYGPSCNDTSKCLNPPRFDADVVLYNAAAAALVAQANAAGATIATVDLYSFVLEKCGGKGYAHCDGFQLPMNVHYTAAGWTALATEMSTYLLK
eukprot:m.164409 g.164409  ORF g.164409 m.164409 type:complete len:389 (-) comp31339_c3_seq1:432-1598(-)